MTFNTIDVVLEIGVNLNKVEQITLAVLNLQE